ncbi:hypothetical protein DQ384_39835 [Sphaerisporangium album]|uniref:Uncharacterized protein n=1 Tax=Sphaerisporangium album TaxID=509200 RepID=A0A367EJ95_9ACTN|nr:hypothetical protein [Sphaerisporangium album]RCG17280.1 hypothetical protein DQ384_39835 [Sphaerisporangium album]
MAAAPGRRKRSPEQVAELAGRAADVDAEYERRTALWVAVQEGRHDSHASWRPPGPIRGGR